MMTVITTRMLDNHLARVVKQMSEHGFYLLAMKATSTQMTQLYVFQVRLMSVITLTIWLPGQPLQPVLGASYSLCQCPFPDHQLPLVGAAVGIHFRQSTHDAFSWLWLL